MSDCHNRVKSELRIFTQGESFPDSFLQEPRWPLLSELTDHFESVTGWKLALIQSQGRSGHPKSGYEQTLNGRLAICDMSERLPAGKPAQHRGLCDRLAESLNALIDTLADDRRRLAEFESRVYDVVPIPYDWWELNGRAGYDRKRLVTWSIATDEQIRIFAAGLGHDCPVDAAFCGAMLTGIFETLCHTDSHPDTLAKLLPTVARAYPSLWASRDDWHAEVEVDPITGDYEISGCHVDRAICLVDVQSGSVVELAEAASAGTLFAGEILVAGADAAERAALRSALDAAGPLTVDHGRHLVQTHFTDRPAVVLHRK